MPVRIAVFTALAMVSFAGNSLLCRLALKQTHIDAASFTTVRLVAGAVTLWLLMQLRRGSGEGRGNWTSAMALFIYAAGFSFAYVKLTAGTGALVLVGAVQATMIGFGLARGERFHARQWIGLTAAAGGMLYLFLPGLSAPPLPSALMMICAGIAWGIYSLRGRGQGDPSLVTTGNFLRGAPIALALSAALYSHASLEMAGVIYAVASGAVGSGLGYICWYTALPSLKATQASVLQLSVPILTAIGGIFFLGETFTVRLAVASAAILGGIGLVIAGRRATPGK